MKTRLAAGLLAVGLLFGAAAAWAIPTLFLAGPTIWPSGQETVAVQGGNAGPQTTNVWLSQLRDTAGYSKVVPLTGQTFQTPNYVSVIQATPAGGLSAWTVVTPVLAFDGMRLQVFTTQSITTFNLTASSGQTVNGNLAGSLSANGNVEYVYSASNATWDRIQ